jgi:hypothetical protein
MQCVIKRAMLSVGCSLIVGASSSEAPAQGSELEKRKAEHLARIDEKLEKLQQHRNCVSGAASLEDLRKCGDVMRDWRKDERDERHERRQEQRKP